MARIITMPLGKVPEEQLLAGIDAVVSKRAGDLPHTFGARARIQTELLTSAHEVTSDNTTVALESISVGQLHAM
jgi:hypothetical protein